MLVIIFYIILFYFNLVFFLVSLLLDSDSIHFFFPPSLSYTRTRAHIISIFVVVLLISSARTYMLAYNALVFAVSIYIFGDRISYETHIRINIMNVCICSR